MKTSPTHESQIKKVKKGFLDFSREDNRVDKKETELAVAVEQTCSLWP